MTLKKYSGNNKWLHLNTWPSVILQGVLPSVKM